MKKFQREDFNTPENWDAEYKITERGGCWRLGIDKFLAPDFLEFSPQRYIEVGGGTGLCLTLVRPDLPTADLWNCDISPYAIGLGKQKYPFATHICCDLNKELLLPQNYFDVIVSQEVLEHLQDPVKSVKFMMDILKDGGIAFFMFPLNDYEEQCHHHLWSYDLNSLDDLFMSHTNQITFRYFKPGQHLYIWVKFRKC